MKHRFEDINKLKQLDRIEYMLKIKAIREKYDYNFGYSYKFGAIIIGFIFLLGIGLFNISKESGFRILLLIPKIAPVLYFYIIFDFVFFFFNYFLKEKFERQIYNEFFKTEIKDRKDKKK